MRRRICLGAAVVVLLAVAGFARLVVAEDAYGRHQFESDVRDHWSFQPLKRPAAPAVPAEQHAWIRNPIDTYVLAGLIQAGLTPTVEADRTTLLRRVYLDLVGLPPTPAEIDAFLADAGDDAYERVVDDLLSRPQYGQRWARHWLDVVRYAETNGYERDSLKPQAWRYRDWVVDAFNADQPFDQFLIEQLAGDEIASSDAESQIATTMLRLGPWDDEPADPLVDRYDQLDDIVATTSAAFMGLTLRCARCHDHKFEPFSQKDYTRWQAIFAPLKRPQRERNDLDREIGPPAEVAVHQALMRQLESRRGELEGELNTLVLQICHVAMADGRLPSAAVAAAAGEKGPVATGSGTPAEKNPGSAPQVARDLPAEVLKALAIEPAKRNDEQKRVLRKHADKLEQVSRELAAGELRTQLDALDRQLAEHRAKYTPSLPKGYVWYEEGTSTDPSRVFQRGDPRSPADEVQPGFPAVLVDESPGPATPTAYSTGRRLQMARWLATPDHPLTGRVLVNRLWQHHFGDGIVATENDFGVMGAPPTNQPLLDWLASELVSGGWRIKRMQRLIVLSAAYRMASTPNAAAEQVDPSGAFLWRFPPRRVEAETLRDTILATSGQLNPTAGGPGIYPKISREVLETQSRPGDGWRDSSPAEASRRSIYIFVKRTLLVPELEVLDFPSTEESCEQRGTSTIAPQALTFLNGEFIHEQAAAFADRLAREAGHDNADRVVRAYRLAYARLPTDAEMSAVLMFLARHEAQVVADAKGSLDAEATRRQALTALCLVLLNTNEFAYLQ